MSLLSFFLFGLIRLNFFSLVSLFLFRVSLVAGAANIDAFGWIGYFDAAAGWLGF